MAVFGDFEPDDAWGTEAPDEEQVTYKLHALREALDDLAGNNDLPKWDDLTPQAQQMARGIGGVIVRYILSNEPETAETLAHTLHDARRFVATSPLLPWHELTPDDREVGITLMQIILDWLERQGALAAA